MPAYAESVRDATVTLAWQLESGRQAAKIQGVPYKTVLRWMNAAPTQEQRWRCCGQNQPGVVCSTCGAPAPPYKG